MTESEALAWMAANPGRVMIHFCSEPYGCKFMIEKRDELLVLRTLNPTTGKWYSCNNLPIGQYREEEEELTVPGAALTEEMRELGKQFCQSFNAGGSSMDALYRILEAQQAEVRRMVEGEK